MRINLNFSTFLNIKILALGAWILLFSLESFAGCPPQTQGERKREARTGYCQRMSSIRAENEKNALKLKFLTALRTIYQGKILANEQYVRDRIQCLSSAEEGHQFRMDNFELCEEFLRGRYNTDTSDYLYGVDSIVESYQEMRLFAALTKPRRRTDQYYILKRPQRRDLRFNNRVRHQFSHFLVDFEDVPEPPDLPHLSPQETCEVDRRFLTKLYEKEQEFYDRRELGIQVSFAEIDCNTTSENRREIGLNFTEILELPHIEERVRSEYTQPLRDELDVWANEIFDAQSEGQENRIEYFLNADDQEYWDQRHREIDAEFQRLLEHEREMFVRWDNHQLDSAMYSGREEIWTAFKEEYYLLLNQYPIIGLMSLPQIEPNEEQLRYQEQTGYPYTHFYPQIKEAFETYLTISENTRSQFGEMNSMDEYDDLLPLMAMENLVDVSWADIVEENPELGGITPAIIEELKGDLESSEFWEVMGEAGVAIALGVSCVSMVLPIGRVKWVARMMLGRLLSSRWAAILACGIASGLVVNLEFVSRANNRYLQEYRNFFSSSGVGPEDGIFVMMAIERLDQRSKDLVLEYIMAPVGTGLIAMRGAVGPVLRLIRNPRTRGRVIEILDRYARMKSRRS